MTIRNLILQDREREGDNEMSYYYLHETTKDLIWEEFWDQVRQS